MHNRQSKDKQNTIYSSILFYWYILFYTYYGSNNTVRISRRTRLQLHQRRSRRFRSKTSDPSAKRRHSFKTRPPLDYHPPISPPILSRRHQFHCHTCLRSRIIGRRFRLITIPRRPMAAIWSTTRIRSAMVTRIITYRCPTRWRCSRGDSASHCRRLIVWGVVLQGEP